MFKRSALFVLVLVLALGLVGPATAQEEKPDLSMIWFAWPPCDALTELVTEYEDANVTVQCIPLAQWHDQIFTDFVGGGGADLPIIDSQWLGEAVTGGHIMELTDWMEENIEIDDYVPAAVTYYGEYPIDSGQYYGVPFMTDVQILIYRKDLFEEAGFEPPATWQGALEQAQHFKESDVIENGWVWFWSGAPGSDTLQVAWNQIAWSFGGALWDPETYTVEGVLNSPENVAAVEFAQALYKTGPEGGGSFSYGEVMDRMCNGTATMTSIWVGVAAGYVGTDVCAEWDNFGFAVPPMGEEYKFTSLGGMPVVVSTYSENPEAALDFVAWFESYETQIKWVELGGYTARQSVLESEDFLNTTDYNPVFADAYQYVRDFWNLPEYNEMMTIQGEWLNEAIIGNIGAKEALDTIAEEHQMILDEAYPEGPPSSDE